MEVLLDRRRGIMRPQLTPGQAQDIEETYQEVLEKSRLALREHAHIVHALVDLLLEKEELLGEDVRKFFDQYGLHTPDVMENGLEDELSQISEPLEAVAVQKSKPR
jgi:ATP-dependent Zn protease